MNNVLYRCDIIVATWNQLDYIKGCVESVFKHTDIKSRLIIVDNASREDTRTYLRGLKGNKNVDIKLIFNSENAGPGKARNIALRDIQAEYVCFLDSDVTVTPGWLPGMIAVSENNPKIGMVNPSSNNFNQMPPPGMSLDDYALSLSQYKDRYIEVGHCISFCMLIKAKVVERIGFLDEEYILALYEDTDYSMKATAAGYRCVIARGSYIWHHGHGSTGRVKKINTIAEKNKERFYKKWGRPLRIFWCFSSHAEGPEFKEVLSSSIELARGGNFIYIYARQQGRINPTPTNNWRPFNKDEVFKRVGLTEHANVHLKFYRGKIFKWSCLWQVLIKRKKKYDLVIVDDENVALLIKRFRPLYKAEVLSAPASEEIAKVARDLKFRSRM